jgi:hypothetical protein
MPLSLDEKEQVRENRFHLDFLEMTLARRGNQDDVYRGPGFIRQLKEGKIEYRIYARTRQPRFETPGLSVGASIPDERFYDLEARDVRGRTWRASRTLPGEDNAFDFEGCICKGTVWKITCSEPAPELSSKDFLWMYLPGEFKLPTTAGTHLIRESPNSRSYSFELSTGQKRSLKLHKRPSRLYPYRVHRQMKLERTKAQWPTCASWSARLLRM